MASFYLISEYFELYYSFSGDCPIHFQLKRSTDTAVSVDLRFRSIARVGMIAILIALACINLHLRISSCSQDHDRRMVAVFFLGGLLLTLCCSALQEKAIWVAVLPLAVTLVLLLRADLISERQLFDLKPHGH
jgi:hypothetical protein